MIEILDLGTPEAVGLIISGKIERPDIDRLYARINEKLAQVDKLSVYIEMERFGGISIDALLEDARQGIPKIGRLRKKAVVSDAKWLEMFTKLGDKLFPSIEARHFSLEERDKAKAWVKA